MDAIKAIRFYHVICAFQHFAGKSNKIIDAESAIAVNDLDTCERVLLEVADWCSNLPQDGYDDLHNLAVQIRKALSMDF